MHTPYSESSGHTNPEVVKENPPATTETVQDTNFITRTPHPTTGEVYTDVNLDKKKKKTKEVEAGPTYQVHFYTLTPLPTGTGSYTNHV